MRRGRVVPGARPSPPALGSAIRAVYFPVHFLRQVGSPSSSRVCPTSEGCFTFSHKRDRLGQADSISFKPAAKHRSGCMHLTRWWRSVSACRWMPHGPGNQIGTVGTRRPSPRASASARRVHRRNLKDARRRVPLVQPPWTALSGAPEASAPIRSRRRARRWRNVNTEIPAD